MRKIPTLFKRDPNDMAHVLPEITPGCEWVLAGEGVATRKYDGTCVMLDQASQWWARREVKPAKTPPAGWWEADRDDVTGKRVGWEPIGQSPFAKYHAEALEFAELYVPGTYELIGPKINGNPERVALHHLIRHAEAEHIYVSYPATFAQLRDLVLYLGGASGDDSHVEGIVWHHPDGRMAKLKARDFPA